MTAPLPTAAQELEARYQRACETPSDINEHLPLLRHLASQCEHVTEFGTRWANGSTIAFLAAQPEQFIAYDLEPKYVVSQPVLDLVQLAGATRFQPRCASTLEVTIEPTELLFIDTLHSYEQCKAELWKHGEPDHFSGVCKCFVKKYLVFHDTSTFGHTGEDGKFPGIVMAIREFQLHHAFPLWAIATLDVDLPQAGLKKGQVLDLQNNNGLLVLEHVRR